MKTSVYYQLLITVLALPYVSAESAAVLGDQMQIALTLKNIQQEVADCLFSTTMSAHNARLNVGIIMALSNRTAVQRFCCECTTLIRIPVFRDRYYRRVLLGHNERNTFKLAQALQASYTFHENRDLVEVGCAREPRILHSLYGADRKVYCVFRPYREGPRSPPKRERLGKRIVGTLQKI